MGTIAESRFHRKAPPDTTTTEQPVSARKILELSPADDAIDIVDLNDLPRIWG